MRGSRELYRSESQFRLPSKAAPVGRDERIRSARSTLSRRRALEASSERLYSEDLRDGQKIVCRLSSEQKQAREQAELQVQHAFESLSEGQ